MFRDWLWPRLAKAVPADDVVDRTLASIGATDTPSELLHIAKGLREELATELNTVAVEGDGLQGALIHGLALRLADPDVPVRQWLLEEVAP